MISKLMFQKMLAAFLSTFAPLFLGSVILTLQQVASGDTNWKVIGLAFLTTGVLPAVVAGVRAVIARFFNLTPTDALHGSNAAVVVGVDKHGRLPVTPTVVSSSSGPPPPF